MKQLFTLFIICFALVACSSEKEEDLIPPGKTSDCDTATVTYSGQVKSIIDLHCIACHRAVSPSGGVALETHAQVKTMTQNGRFGRTIRHEAGIKPMPQGGAKLSACKIRTIEIWEAAGCPDN